MTTIELDYVGHDVIIPKEMVENTLGLISGDKIEIRSKVQLVPIERTPEEIDHIKRVFEEFRDAFEPHELDDWENRRQKLWSNWPTQE